MPPHGFMSGMPPGIPGGMPGLDPFRLGQRLQAESNNNLMMAAAEKARMMMMSGYPGPVPPPRPVTSSPIIAPPVVPTSTLPLPSELLARYSAVQASLGLYNPALLAAAIRSSSTSSPPSLNSSLSSPRSPSELPSPRTSSSSHRFSPYIIPRNGERHSPGAAVSPKIEAEDDQRSSSPCSSPPSSSSSLSRPAFPIFR